MDQRIFLIGGRGTGKSTVGLLLADKLGWGFLDTDLAIERREGRSIRRIFEEDGEAYFREQERALLVEAALLSHHVIATGGGAVLREDNRRLLRETGFVVWLTAEVDAAWERLQADPTTRERRPALGVGGREEVAITACTREPFYRECAHFHLDSTRRTPAELVELIRARWAERSR
jgi:shikimate kinase